MNLAKKLIARVAEQRKSIVVCGDRMVDRWHHGRVAECQDGCSKFVTEQVVETAGGASNARNCLSHWDVSAKLYSYIANIPVKERFVDAGRIVFRVDRDRSLMLTPETILTQRDALEAIKNADAVLLSDYDKGFLTPEFIGRVAALCLNRGIPCVADCKRAPEVYEGCTLKGNADYWKRYCDLQPKRVITCGASEPWITGEDNLQREVWPLVRCINHVGAGDCFAAHLALALAYGFSLRDAAAVAHSAGRVYVTRQHNTAPYPHEVAADMDLVTVP